MDALSTPQLVAEADDCVQTFLQDTDSLYWNERMDLPAILGQHHPVYQHPHFTLLSKTLGRRIADEDHYLQHCGCVVQLHEVPPTTRKHAKCAICGIPIRTVRVDGVGGGRSTHISCALFVTCAVPIDHSTTAHAPLPFLPGAAAVV